MNGAIKRPLERRRRLLWLGFTGLLVAMVAMGLDVSVSLGKTSATNEALIKGFRDRDQILDELREAMILSGTLLRDYLSESDPARARREKDDLEALRKRVEHLLSNYQRRLQPQQAEMFATMKVGILSYLESLSPPLHWDSSTRLAKGDRYRRDAVGPLHAEALRLRHAVYALNKDQLDAGEREILAEHKRLRRQLILASTLAVILSTGLALAVMTRIHHLEKGANDQFRRIAQASEELRSLADRLEAAQEDERRALSRELHDEIGQSLSALLMDLGKLEATLPAQGSSMRHLFAAKKTAEANVRAVRNMALLLRPSMLDDLGLVAALKWQGRETARRSGLRVSVDADDATDRLPEPLRTCIYRIVQESLNNVIKHSKAGSVRVLVQQRQSRVEISVQDNGQGFNAAEKGMGLLGMEERVARVGGELRVESAKGGGTVLSAVLPALEAERGS